MAVRKELKDIEGDIRPLDRHEVEDKLNRLKGEFAERNRALGAFLYLSGCRIEEVLSYRKERNLKRVVLDKKTGEKVSSPIQKTIEAGQPILRRQVEFEDTFIKVNTVRCLKRRKPIFRTVVIPINKWEQVFIDMFRKYTETLDSEAALFPIKRARAYQILSKVGLFPHYFRHMRSTVLSTDYAFSPTDLKHFYGWRSSASGDSYVHLNYQDLLNKMAKK